MTAQVMQMHPRAAPRGHERSGSIKRLPVPAWAVAGFCLCKYGVHDVTDSLGVKL